LPTRVFHWALVACVLGLVTSAQIGGSAMDWHFRFGYAVLSLLLFRLIWGWVGGKWSRFASFLYSPATIIHYLKGQRQPDQAIGHNPLGALSVFALLGFLLLQAASGLVSDDEIAAAGPFVKWVSSAVTGKVTFYHADVGAVIIFTLIGLHVGAILFYRFKKNENLVRPMIFGDKDIPVMAPASRDDAWARLLALALFSGCAALVATLIQWAG
jgi:cytochrome b